MRGVQFVALQNLMCIHSLKDILTLVRAIVTRLLLDFAAVFHSLE